MDNQDELIKNNIGVRFSYHTENLDDGSINSWIRDNVTLNDYSFGSNFISCKRMIELLNILYSELENQRCIKLEAYRLLNEFQYYFDKDTVFDDFDHKDLKVLKRLSCMSRDMLQMDDVDIKKF